MYNFKIFVIGRYTYITIPNIGEIIRLLSYNIIGCIIHTLEFIFIELM